MKFRFPLHVHLSRLFVLMTLIVSGAIATIATIGYRMSYSRARPCPKPYAS